MLLKLFIVAIEKNIFFADIEKIFTTDKLSFLILNKLMIS